MKNLLLLFGLVIGLCATTHAQRVTGSLLDETYGDALIGATVSEKGTTNGTTSDINGKFSIDLDLSSPKVLVISYIGYSTKEVTVSKDKRYVEVSLGEDAVVTDVVEIRSSRVAKELQDAPVTIERLGIKGIKETPAPTFYDGLANLKGVDMTSASLTFKVINTRGFNSTSPVRTLQLIDGMDNQAPGLNFSLGNFVGASEVDVESVDIVVGANSATYGSNAFNGVINITTKDPFKYPGLNLQVKVGTRALFDGAIRYAHVSRGVDESSRESKVGKAFARFNNRFLKDKFGAKFNVAYLRANDFEATNYNPTEIQPLNDEFENSRDNIGGYDAVNIYGDEANADFTGVVDGPGVYVYRNGYKEEDLADYNSKSLKTNAYLYYKLRDDIQLIGSVNYGTGTTVYQGDNRYSVKGIQFIQNKYEIKGDRFGVKWYKTWEDAGDSYDIVFTAVQLLNRSKTDGQWLRQYQRGYNRQFRMNDERTDESSLRAADAEGRRFADNFEQASTNQSPFLFPGTDTFNTAFREITENPSFLTGGSKFQDQSSLWHAEAFYDFDLSKLNEKLPKTFKVGASYRRYIPNSFGTIFNDTLKNREDAFVLDSLLDLRNPNSQQKASLDAIRDTGFVQIRTYEYSAYAATTIDALDERLKFILAARMDKHQNFGFNFSPGVSALFKFRQTDNVRVTLNRAFRNPTLQDQFLLYDIGRIILKGNIDGERAILLDDFRGIPGDTVNPSFNRTGDTIFTFIDGVKPEQVTTIEAGYKGIPFRNFYLDISGYHSWYKDFIGTVIALESPFRPNGVPKSTDEYQALRLSTNSREIVRTYGFSVGVNYYIKSKYSISGNYTFTDIALKDSDDALIPNYNTPQNKFNITVAGRRLKNWGFAATFKYVQGFRYEAAPQFTGDIPGYGLLDVQLNYTFKERNTILKASFSNLLNNEHFQAYGSPLITRLFVFSVNVDLVPKRYKSEE